MATKSFAFSGCGWLNPFYLGVIEVMKRELILTEKSLVAGTSGGSLGAVLAVSNIDTKESLEAIIKFSRDKSFHSNIDVGLKTTLDNMLPSDIVEKCNGRLHVVTTKIWPSFERKPIIINTFKNREHLLDTIAASCFIPFYSTTNKLFTSIREHPDELYLDGGVVSWMPPIGDIRVSPFPKELTSLFGKRKPDICLPVHAFPVNKLVSWILSPAPSNQLRNLYEIGKSETEIYIAEANKRKR